VELGTVSPALLKQFDCRQELFYADLNWDLLIKWASGKSTEFRELPKQLPVYRDLAMVVAKSLPFEKVESAIRGAKLDKLQEVKLFDIFESEKLGKDKKSLAVSFTFLDEERTLTDKEIDSMVGKIMTALERDVQAEIRK
jgi:phenylalanyl-tRNA synthetase beta chain